VALSGATPAAQASAPPSAKDKPIVQSIIRARMRSPFRKKLSSPNLGEHRMEAGLLWTKPSLV
jgi:hypothetical protein